MLPPACWSTFWKSIFKHQLGCRFDILDSISSLFLYFDICNYICLDTTYHFFLLYLYFLNNLYFFKYSCTNIFHRRSLCTFYWDGYVWFSQRNDWNWLDWRDMKTTIFGWIMINKYGNFVLQDVSKSISHLLCQIKLNWLCGIGFV